MCDDTMTSTPFYIEDWRVDPANNLIQQGDQHTRLEPRAMDVLVYLAKKQGQVVSREELEATVWDKRIVTYDAMSAAITKLRKAFNDDPRQPRIIETVSKRGYRLMVPVTLDSAPDNTASMAVSVSPNEWSAPPRNKNRLIVALGSLLLLFALIAFWWIKQSDQPARQFSATMPSVVVLPFHNLSQDPSQDYFSDGITDDLITDLSKVNSLRVIARQSSYHYKQRPNYSLEDVAKELGVQYIVQGSVQRSGSRIRINVQLTSTQKGESIWAQRFDTDVHQLFDTQDNITQQVIKAMTVTLSKQEIDTLQTSKASNFEAYDIFLQGQRYAAQRSREGNDLAMTAYQQSIAIDPHFGRAYGALAVVMTYSYRFQWTDLSLGEARERSLELARKAVSLNQTSPQIYWALGYVHIHRKEYEAAEQAARQAVELSPNYADGYGLLAYISNWRGKGVQAEKLIKKAISLNPYHTFDYPWNLGLAYYLQGRYEKAVETLQDALERNPNALYPRLFLTASYVRLGRIDDARWEVENISVARPTTTLSHLRTVMPFENKKQLDAILQDLSQAGLREK